MPPKQKTNPLTKNEKTLVLRPQTCITAAAGGLRAHKKCIEAAPPEALRTQKIHRRDRPM